MKASAIIITTLLAPVMTGCNASSQVKPAGMKPTITIDEANKRVEDHIKRALQVLPKDAKLTNPDIIKDQACDDPDDQGPQGRVFATHDYQIEGLEPTKFAAHFDKLRKWWADNGYTVEDNRRKHEYLQVQNKKDGVRLSLQSNPRGQLYLGADSPCVWPDGKPPK